MQLKCANSKPDLPAGTHRGSPFAAGWGMMLFCSHPILVQATLSIFVLPPKKTSVLHLRDLMQIRIS